MVLDVEGTKEIRTKLNETKKVKITINIDQDSLGILRGKAGQTGIPYQRLLNQTLKEALQRKEKAEARLDHLEKEVAKLKRRLAA